MFFLLRFIRRHYFQPPPPETEAPTASCNRQLDAPTNHKNRRNYNGLKAAGRPPQPGVK
jgi:hypothetical protein